MTKQSLGSKQVYQSKQSLNTLEGEQVHQSEQVEQIDQIKDRLKDFEIPKKERLMKLRLVQKLIENTNEDNLNDNLKAISKMLTDIKKVYYFNLSDLLK